VALFVAIQRHLPLWLPAFSGSPLNLPSESLNSSLLEIDQPLEVVTSSHHGH